MPFTASATYGRLSPDVQTKRKDNTMKRTLGLILVAMFTLGTVTFVGCQKKEEGPMEKAGKAVDNAAEKTKDAMKEGAEKADEAAKDAAKKVDDATK
jgi:hypothetical protein